MHHSHWNPFPLLEYCMNICSSSYSIFQHTVFYVSLDQLFILDQPISFVEAFLGKGFVELWGVVGFGYMEKAIVIVVLGSMRNHSTSPYIVRIMKQSCIVNLLPSVLC